MSESEECSVSVPGKSFCITGVTKLGRDIFYALIVQAGGALGEIGEPFAGLSGGGGRSRPVEDGKGGELGAGLHF